MQHTSPHRDRVITLELVQDALGFIPPDIGHDERARVAFAVFDGLGEAGGNAWLDWAGGRSKPDELEDRATWKSAHKPGGVKIGTLFGMAKDRGFRFPADDGSMHVPNAAEQAAQEAEKRRQREVQSEKYRLKADEAAAVAVKLWAAASEVGESAYLQRKRVKAYGVRFLANGTVVVPMRNADGVLQSLQFIAPGKPENGTTDKRFLANARINGLWHQLGDRDGVAVLLIAEGYATGATNFEATGLPVAVAFNAGNLVHVARELRRLHPAATILVCADDDRETEQRTGKNTGRDKAATAARAVASDEAPAGVVFPEGLPDGGTDFNDLGQHAGLEAVRVLIEAAAAAPSIPKPQRGPKSTAGDAIGGAAGLEAVGTSKTVSKRRGSARAGDGGEEPPPDGDGDSPGGRRDPFSVDDFAVWYTPPNDDSGRRRVCGPLRVIAWARDSHDTHAALLLEFDTPFRTGRRWLMPLAMLSGDGAAYRSELLSQGFMCPTDTNRRKWLTDYLQSRRPKTLVRHVARVGWSGRAYVLPTETLTADAEGEQVVFYSEAGIEANFSHRGSIDAWRSTLGRVCVDNSRLCFATACAFAGPLLKWAPGTSGGGVHFYGDSSIGKTTGLLIGASIWGKGSENDPESYMQKWRATSNGLEFQAEQHNDCTMFLDELGQTDALDAGPIAYMLADGVGKLRGKASGGLRHKPTWSLLFVSSGELTLAQHMETAGKTMRGGQEVRLIPIPAEVSPGSTLEALHEFATGHELSVWVKQHAARVYGCPGREWLLWLVNHTEGLATRVREGIEAFERDLPMAKAGGQVKRGARRFALIATAGEMATAAGLTGWPVGEATRAARICFDAWVRTRAGGVGASEQAEAVRQVQYWIEKNGDANLTPWGRIADSKKPNTPMRGGFRRLVDEAGVPIKLDAAQVYVDDRAPAETTSTALALTEYLIAVEPFKRDVCKGYDPHFVARVLKGLDLLVHEPDRLTIKHRVPSLGKQTFYHIKPGILSVDL